MARIPTSIRRYERSYINSKCNKLHGVDDGIVVDEDGDIQFVEVQYEQLPKRTKRYYNEVVLWLCELNRKWHIQIRKDKWLT